MPSPTALSLKALRREGFQAAVVERWLQIPGKKFRSDLWRFGDILAVHPVQKRFAIIQATSKSNIASRLVKARRQPELGVWLQAGGEFQVWGWCRIGGKWHVKRVAVLPGDMTEVVARPPRKRRKDRFCQGELFDSEAARGVSSELF